MANRRLTRHLIDALEPDKSICEVCDTELHDSGAKTRAKHGDLTLDLGGGNPWLFAWEGSTKNPGVNA